MSSLITWVWLIKKTKQNVQLNSNRQDLDSGYGCVCVCVFDDAVVLVMDATAYVTAFIMLFSSVRVSSIMYTHTFIIYEVEQINIGINPYNLATKQCVFADMMVRCNKFMLICLHVVHDNWMLPVGERNRESLYCKKSSNLQVSFLPYKTNKI